MDPAGESWSLISKVPRLKSSRQRSYSFSSLERRILLAWHLLKRWCLGLVSDLRNFSAKFCYYSFLLETSYTTSVQTTKRAENQIYNTTLMLTYTFARSVAIALYSSPLGIVFALSQNPNSGLARVWEQPGTP